MRRAIEEMFRKTGKEMLSYQEFRDSFKHLNYGLTDNDVNMLIALADEENEKIDWKQFISLGLEAIKIFFMRVM
jgi:Ca2+-binding EF-hand superfamily protein